MTQVGAWWSLQLHDYGGSLDFERSRMLTSSPSVNPVSKRILLIDLGDSRRQTRSEMLKHAGYDVVLRESHIDAESLDHEGHFDLILLTLHRKKLDDAAAYSERLRKRIPHLPLLLLTDYGVFVPRGTLSPSIETGQPDEMIRQIASMIAGSTHIRELDIDSSMVVSGDNRSGLAG